MDQLKAALYDLRYIYLNLYLGIHFSSVLAMEPHDQIRHPFPHEHESYIYDPATTSTFQN